MIKQALIGVVAAGSVGYYVEDPVLVQYQEPPDHYSVSSTRMTTRSATSPVDAKAYTFVEQLHDFQKVAQRGTLDSEYVLMYLDRIRSSFEGAYGAIEVMERDGELSQTERARELMEYAIDEYMSGGSMEKSLPITRDLEAYSRFLTETLIVRSHGAVETVH